MNVRQALAQSCDVFFYRVGEMLGVDRLAHYSKMCGLGAKTGIALGGEASGLVPTAWWKLKRFGARWQPGETFSIAIGQGFVNVTPLHMSDLVSAVVKRATLYRPMRVKEIRGHDSS